MHGVTAATFGPTIWTIYLYPILEILLPVTIGTISLSVALAFFGARAINKTFGETLLFISPFGWLGGICGLIAGTSTEPLIGALLTGMLTIVTTMLSYLLGKDALADWRPLIQFAIILLCVSAVVGLTFGRIHKARGDSFDRDYASWRFEYDNAIVPAIQIRTRYDLCRARMPTTDAVKCEALLLSK